MDISNSKKNAFTKKLFTFYSNMLKNNIKTLFERSLTKISAWSFFLHFDYGSIFFLYKTPLMLTIGKIFLAKKKFFCIFVKYKL